jgi:hypothetical protein
MTPESKPREIAPLKRIEGLKKQTDGLLKDNDQYKDAIEVLDNRYHGVNAAILDLNNKKVQARYDMLEIKRDLATYEVNFSAFRSIRSRLHQIIDTVKDSNKELELICSK